MYRTYEIEHNFIKCWRISYNIIIESSHRRRCDRKWYEIANIWAS